MPSVLHEQLCDKALIWLRRNGFSVYGKNITASGSRERVDAIGFRDTCAVVIESKVSISDFIADKKKPERTLGGAGTYRFYIAPKDLIPIQRIPAKWGLIEIDKNKIITTVGPTGNLWPHFSSVTCDNWGAFANQPNEKTERSLLFSIARRRFLEKN